MIPSRHKSASSSVMWWGVCTSWDRSVWLGPLGAGDPYGGPHDLMAAQTETHMVQFNLHYDRSSNSRAQQDW